MLKNKTIVLLVSFLAITIVLDFFMFGIISTILQNDTEKLGEVNATFTTFEKSGSLKFVYASMIIIGLLQVGIAGGLVFVGMKSDNKIIHITAGIAILIGLYGIIAGILKMTAGDIDLTSTEAQTHIDAYVTTAMSVTEAESAGAQSYFQALGAQDYITEQLANANWENWANTIMAAVGLTSTGLVGFTIAQEI